MARHTTLTTALGLLLALAAARAAAFREPQPAGDVYFFEGFDATWRPRWESSSRADYGGKFEVQDPQRPSVPGDRGLVAPVEGVRYAAGARLFREFSFAAGRPLVLQYEVKLQNHLTCGGAYAKLLAAEGSPRLSELDGATPYTVMFGPDRCGETNKVHLIFRFRSPATGEWEEKHLTGAPAVKNDAGTHLYRLEVMPNSTYRVSVDGVVERSGSLLDDFEPPFNPPAQIADPADAKPGDWVDDAEIPDPAASKPAGWVDEEFVEDPDDAKPEAWDESAPSSVPDPAARKPSEWDDDVDGDWEPPMIPNPACETGCGPWTRAKIRNPAFKGRWEAPMIPNPAYRGEWHARMIPNPGYFVERNPFARLAPVGAVAFEILTNTPGILFDNILVTSDAAVADAVKRESFDVKWAREASQRAAPAPGEEEFDAEDDGSWRYWAQRGLRDMGVWMVEFSDKVVAGDPGSIAVTATFFIGVATIVLMIACAGESTLNKRPKKQPEQQEQQEQPEDQEHSPASTEPAKGEDAATEGEPVADNIDGMPETRVKSE
eukprot:m51a1_g11077 putative calnexin precursor (547) ;mRNA; r:565730-567448